MRIFAELFWQPLPVMPSWTASGVGYDVTVSMNTFTQLPDAGKEVSLFIYTHVREDQIALFGFHLAEEKSAL